MRVTPEKRIAVLARRGGNLTQFLPSKLSAVRKCKSSHCISSISVKHRAKTKKKVDNALKEQLLEPENENK